MNVDARGWTLMRPRMPGHWELCGVWECSRMAQWEKAGALPDDDGVLHLCDEHHAQDLT